MAVKSASEQERHSRPKAGVTVEDDHEDDHDQGLEAEEDEGRAHRGQGQDLAGKATFLTMPGVVDDDPGPSGHPGEKRFQTSRPAKRKITKSGHPVPRHAGRRRSR